MYEYWPWVRVKKPSHWSIEGRDILIIFFSFLGRSQLASLLRILACTAPFFSPEIISWGDPWSTNDQFTAHDGGGGGDGHVVYGLNRSKTALEA